ncbi:hypothetical protein FPZ42_11240 [Mucilaginibacter achroorhodeus]|uniref:DUF4149 domain-containing protein n=1 Tax=Mucilaginibacter achroorhodeus TaxID=2599294 RepID=A0A563U4B6_9SPHI|nr:hypothetical protein [Mucilaginibacter achroorhodeus]TWR26194.1 hypothetical protein FPZ42_11240 [Mucilaginibacter achroorhodeus]
MEKTLQEVVKLAGVGQLLLATVSLIVPKVFKWPQELSKVQPMIKKLFWVYAVYILVINSSFGLLSVTMSGQLINATPLACAVTGFIAVYWISRLAIQFLYFDRTNFPKGVWPLIKEMVLVTAFVFFSIVYSYSFYLNFK